MNAKLIFWPLLIQIWITFCAYVLLARRKSAALRLGQVDLQRRALHEDAWPDAVVQVNNHIRNSFELPTLFYALVLSLYALAAVDRFALALAGIFVVTRLAHAYVHLGRNIVAIRRPLFMAGAITLLAMSGLVVRALLQP
ncbi:hypothetical protein C7S18_05005 [Ahniella affigens]|uniref:MAPEG family protein n=1 Tax=Ahniella affigens TaxID=2021234 RepID=A0A2P1PYT3_9GAMM|nr:MAPEG family protein [Ahniella affigens]AVQ00002.1 hypothetical protein C7S18_05005 [Ahniella affigens]